MNPVLLGAGKPVLQGLAHDVELTLSGVRRFRSGNVLLTYARATTPAHNAGR